MWPVSSCPPVGNSSRLAMQASHTGWSTPMVLWSNRWRQFLRELLAAGRSVATLRSYGMDLLRWWRFLDAVDVAWDRATRIEARDFSCWIQLAVKQRRRQVPELVVGTVESVGPPNPVTGIVAERHRTAERRLQAAEHTQPGVAIPDSGGALRRAVTPNSIGRHIWAEDIATGKRRNLSYEADEAFWAWATIEVLRLTGIRCEDCSS